MNCPKKSPYDDVLVDMLSHDGSVDTGRVSLIAYRLLMLVLALRAVSGGDVLVNVFGDIAGNMRGGVLVMSVELLAVATFEEQTKVRRMK